jgi:hypothetical protein
MSVVAALPRRSHPARTLGPGWVRLGLALAAVLTVAPEAWGKKPAPICAPLVPCSDPRGCPDLSIDQGVLQGLISIDMHTFAATDCAVVEGMATAGTRRMLLFGTQSNNDGPGALFLGNPADHPDWFDYSTCHGHYHIKDYAAYRLWTPAGYDRWKTLRAANPGLCAQQVMDANPDLAGQFVKGNKLGLCFWDVLMMGQISVASQSCTRIPDPQTYVSCDYAGLSVCWADIYEPGLYGFVDGQWIDVTDLPDGQYVLENESNSTHLITEVSYTNNSAAVVIQIKNRNVKILGPA